MFPLFATGVDYTGGKFAAGVVDTSGNLPPASLTPDSIPLRLFRIFPKIRRDIPKSRCTTGINNTGGKFATGINNASKNGGKICRQYR